ncbi:MAG TPA: hypothetical protein VLD65_14040 [Anaerolineales bacterium]|nr:hypothetical protein [Anaerolineales bacterium]
MKVKRKTLSETTSLFILVVFIVSLVIVIRTFILGGGVSQNAPSQQQYPPPQPTWKSPAWTETATEIPIVATIGLEGPPTPTPWPTPTPYPSATLRPGPTDTPVPLIFPAADASGIILFLSGSSNENTTLNKISVDGNGLVVGSNQLLATGTNLYWENAYASPDGSRIAFYGQWCAEGLLFTDNVKFELPFSNSISPCGHFFDWDPDNHHILILAGVAFQGLWLVDTDTWDYTILASPGIGDIRGGSISPDGRKVIYSWEAIGPGEIWMVNTDGQDAHRLSDVYGAPGNFAWSPDGSSIIFLGPEGMTLMDQDGKILRTLKSPFGCGIQHYSPIWSPDSRFLLIQNDLHDLPYTDPWSPKAFRDAGICLVDVVNDTTAWLPPGEQTGNMHPAWSPDGSQVAFVSDRSGTSEIWAINIDGTNLRQLTNSGIPVRFPFWIR